MKAQADRSGKPEENKENLQGEKPSKKKGSLIKPLIALVVIAILSGSGFLLWKTISPALSTGESNSAQTPRASDASASGMPIEKSLPMGPLQVLEEPDTQNEPAPILAIPKERERETPSAANAPKIPQGFGFEENPEAPSKEAPIPSENLNPNPKPEMIGQGKIPLEKPISPAGEPRNEPGKVDSIDPREIGVTANDGPEKEYEETSLTVQRTLTAVMGENKQMIRLKIPVMYKSRTLRLDKETLVEAKRIQKELHEKAKTLAALKGDLEKLLIDWNKLIETSTPHETLLPESPSLPQNQSAGKINREENKDMEPGKSISYEIITP